MLAQRTSEMSPDYDSPYYRSALAYWLWKGETAEARKVLNALIAKTPESPFSEEARALLESISQN